MDGPPFTPLNPIYSNGDTGISYNSYFDHRESSLPSFLVNALLPDELPGRDYYVHRFSDQFSSPRGAPAAPDFFGDVSRDVKPEPYTSEDRHSASPSPSASELPPTPPDPSGPDAPQCTLHLLHKPRGTKGLYQRIRLGEGLRVTKGKGKRLKLELRSAAPASAATAELLLVDFTSSPTPRELRSGDDGFDVLSATDVDLAVGYGVDYDVKIDRVAKVLQFLVRLGSRHAAGGVLQVASMQFEAHNNGRLKDSRSDAPPVAALTTEWVASMGSAPSSSSSQAPPKPKRIKREPDERVQTAPASDRRDRRSGSRAGGWAPVAQESMTLDVADLAGESPGSADYGQLVSGNVSHGSPARGTDTSGDCSPRSASAMSDASSTTPFLPPPGPPPVPGAETEVGRHYVVGGDMHVGGTVQARSFFQFSDLRLKADVRELIDALKIVENLKGQTFTWRSDLSDSTGDPGRRVIGFIAQEVHRVCPELVRQTADGLLTVSYAELVPLIVEAFKEHLTRVAAEKEQVNSQLSELRQRLDELDEAASRLPRVHRIKDPSKLFGDPPFLEKIQKRSEAKAKNPAMFRLKRYCARTTAFLCVLIGFSLLTLAIAGSLTMNDYATLRRTIISVFKVTGYHLPSPAPKQLYCEVSLGRQKFRTQPADALRPIWDYTLKENFEAYDLDVMQFQLYGTSSQTEDGYAGPEADLLLAVASIHVDDVETGERMAKSLAMFSPGHVVVGINGQENETDHAIATLETSMFIRSIADSRRAVLQFYCFVVGLAMTCCGIIPGFCVWFVGRSRYAAQSRIMRMWFAGVGERIVEENDDDEDEMQPLKRPGDPLEKDVNLKAV